MPTSTKYGTPKPMDFIDLFYTKDGELFRKSDNRLMGWGSRYKRFDYGGSKYLVHRAIFLLTYGYLPDLVDHIDQDKMNNHPSNLRESNKSLNALNAPIRADNTSGINGVSWLKSNKRWEVYCQVNGKKQGLGYFLCLLDAVAARLRAAK